MASARVFHFLVLTLGRQPWLTLSALACLVSLGALGLAVFPPGGNGLLGLGPWWAPHDLPSVSGTVEYQGKPVVAGTVEFTMQIAPIEYVDDYPEVVRAEVRNGRFRVDGMVPGLYRVRVFVDGVEVPVREPGMPSNPHITLYRNEARRSWIICVEVRENVENVFDLTFR